MRARTIREACAAVATVGLVLGLLVLGPATARVQGDGNSPDVEPTAVDRSTLGSMDPLVERFLARPDEPVRHFRVRRRLRCAGIGRAASMEVLVELSPEDGFRWQVLSEEGSKIMRNRGFRGMLEKEAKAYASDDVSRASLTGDNYHLTMDGIEPDGLVRLRARPRRREKTLIDGTFTVTPGDADLVRVEGRLARGPSLWVPRVEVVRRYRRIGGHRVMVRMESTAHIRFFGQVQMVAEYEYEVIDGQVIPEASPTSTDSSFAQPSPAVDARPALLPPPELDDAPAVAHLRGTAQGSGGRQASGPEGK